MIIRVTRLVFLNILRKSYVKQKSTTKKYNKRVQQKNTTKEYNKKTYDSDYIERANNSAYPANLGSLMNKISMITDGLYSRIAAS
jgi:acyl-ACP thioesterase